MTDTTLTAFDAQSMQDLEPDLVWIVTDRDPDHLSVFVARPHAASLTGGDALSAVLVARTLADLHFLLPKGLTRFERAPVLADDRVGDVGGAVDGGSRHPADYFAILCIDGIKISPSVSLRTMTA